MQVYYRIVKSLPRPDGGEERLILIAPEQANEHGLRALAARLAEDAGGQHDASVFVYTDGRAAELYDKVRSAKATVREIVHYDRHYVGHYGRDAGTGRHQFEIYLACISSADRRGIMLRAAEQGAAAPSRPASSNNTGTRAEELMLRV